MKYIVVIKHKDKPIKFLVRNTSIELKKEML